MSRRAQFPEHFFSVDEDETAGLDMFLRGDQGPMKGSTICRFEPTARIVQENPAAPNADL